MKPKTYASKISLETKYLQYIKNSKEFKQLMDELRDIPEECLKGVGVDYTIYLKELTNDGDYIRYSDGITKEVFTDKQETTLEKEIRKKVESKRKLTEPISEPGGVYYRE